jgi:serine/threonine-protein kinase
VFAGSPTSGLSRVPAAGGDPEVFTELDTDNGEVSHRWPQVLPNDRAVLFTSIGGKSAKDVSIHVLDLETGQRQVVKEGGSYGRYVESGHVVYADSGTLFAIPFDLDSLSVSGSAVPVVEGVTASGSELDAQFSSSPDGKLAYLTGAAGQTALTQIMVDREGQIEEVGVDPGEFYNPRFSPDRARLAVEVQTGENLDIWIYDLERKVPMRLTFNEGSDEYPAWARDGSAVYYSAERDGEVDIYRRDPSGSGEAERVLERAGPQAPSSFSPDGTTLAFTEYLPETESDIWLLSMTDDGEPRPLVVTEFTEYGPEFSPDGRWIAYGSNETGNFEVYITSATGDGKWQVTNGGGAWPVWAPDGRSLAFVWGPTMSQASVDSSDGELRLGRPEPLFTANFRFLADGNRYYDVSPDGSGFLMLQDQSQASDSDHEHIRVVLNWFDELRATFAQFEQ